MNSPGPPPPVGLRLSQPLRIEIERRPDAAIVRLIGACSMDVSTRISEQLVELASESSPRIVVDLSQLEFIDSTGLGGLVAAYLRARRNQGHLVLAGPQESILALLDTTRLTRVFNVFPGLAEALAARDLGSAAPH